MESFRIYRKALVLVIGLLTVSIAFSQVDDIEDHNFEVNENDLPYNALTTTPYTLPKGSLVYQNLYLTFNTLSYGISDRLSVSGGFSLFDLDLGLTNIAMSQVKYNFYRDEKYAVSISNINFYHFGKVYNHRLEIEQREMNIIPIFFLNTSIKTKTHSFLTFGMGVYFAGEAARPIFTIGYQNRFSKNVAFIADLWFPFVDLERSTSILPIPAAGFRFYTKGGATFDVGFPFAGMKIPLAKSKNR